MIYEFRTYTLKPGKINEVVKRFGEAYEARKKYSEMSAFWTTEIGPLNQIIHVWGYSDFAERARVRAEAAKDPNWPPKIQEFIDHQEVEILNPFPFAPAWKPGPQGPVYEIRQYRVQPGTQGDIMEKWEQKLPARLALSPLITAGFVEMGEANRFIHIWAYKSMDERMAIRKKAVEMGVWPTGGGVLLHQQNKIVLPTAFSPSQ